MMNYFVLISVGFLASILVSDINTRRIPIVFLIGEAIISLSLRYSQIEFSFLKELTLNYVTIGIQVLIIWFWIRFMEDRSEKGLWSYFGEADLFMLAILAVNLSPLLYLLVTTVTCITASIVWMIISLMNKRRVQTVPFAGFLAGGLIIIRILEMTGSVAGYYSNNFLQN